MFSLCTSSIYQFPQHLDVAAFCLGYCYFRFLIGGEINVYHPYFSYLFTTCFYFLSRCENITYQTSLFLFRADYLCGLSKPSVYLSCRYSFWRGVMQIPFSNMVSCFLMSRCFKTTLVQRISNSACFTHLHHETTYNKSWCDKSWIFRVCTPWRLECHTCHSNEWHVRHFGCREST